MGRRDAHVGCRHDARFSRDGTGRRCGGLLVANLDWSDGTPRRIEGLTAIKSPAQLVLIACGFTGPETSTFDAFGALVSDQGRALTVMEGASARCAPKTQGAPGRGLRLRRCTHRLLTGSQRHRRRPGLCRRGRPRARAVASARDLGGSCPFSERLHVEQDIVVGGNRPSSRRRRSSIASTARRASRTMVVASMFMSLLYFSLVIPESGWNQCASCVAPCSSAHSFMACVTAFATSRSSDSPSSMVLASLLYTSLGKPPLHLVLGEDHGSKTLGKISHRALPFIGQKAAAPRRRPEMVGRYRRAPRCLAPGATPRSPVRSQREACS